MRIAYLTSIHPDFDARVWKYAVTMARRQHEVHLVCPWNVPNGEIREGVKLHTFPRAVSRAFRPVSISWHLSRNLRSLFGKVDLFHFHDLDILPFMALLGTVKPVVYDVHENYPDEMLVRKWIPRYLRGVVSRSVAFSQSLFSRAVGNAIFVVPEIQKDFPAGVLRTEIIRNYATTDLLSEISSDYLSRKDAVLFLGSNYEGNGTLLVLEIARAFKVRQSKLEFILIDRWSDESMKQRALGIISKKRLTNIRIVPNVAPQKIVQYLNQATIGISATLRLPNHINALPTKLFEYMAAGLPIVSSDLPNAIRLSEQTGAVMLCRPEEPASFVDAIEQLMLDRNLAWQMGQNGQRAFRDRFSWESQVGTLERFYADVLRGSDHQVVRVEEERTAQ